MGSLFRMSGCFDNNTIMSMISRVRVARPALELWSRSRVVFRSASSSASKADNYELVVGLEIHAQLRTGRKLFSSPFGSIQADSRSKDTA